MNAVLCFCLIAASAAVTNAQTNAPLTNHVWIGNRGLCFSIKEETSAQGDKAVFSDAPLSWILDNPKTNYANVHSQGIQRTFSLKLFDDQGQEVPLTDYGQWMNSGPRSNIVSGSIHFSGLLPGNVSIRDFPAVDKMFQIPKPGDYLLEVRYWYMVIGAPKETWRLSDPVRLKVTKREPTGKPPLPGAETNASAGLTR